jgi:hypothetical protein
MALRDRLSTDFRHNPKAPRVWINDLRDYFRLLSECRDVIDKTLAKLNLVATKTWYAGQQIRIATAPVFTALAGVTTFDSPACDDVLSKENAARAGLAAYLGGGIPLTLTERHNGIMDLRVRVFEASKNFAERPLIRRFRLAVKKDRQIELREAWINSSEGAGHRGIVVPGAWVEPTVEPVATFEQLGGANSAKPKGTATEPAMRSTPAGEWTDPMLPSKCAKLFGVTPKTLKRMHERGEVVIHIVTTKSWCLRVDTLPPNEQKKYRQN